MKKEPSESPMRNSKKENLKWTILGSFVALLLMACLFYGARSYMHFREESPSYPIEIVVHGGELPALFFEEILDLSCDQPQNFYLFDLKAAEEKLLQVAIFKKATLGKIKPNILIIDYLLRTPVAYASDFTNTAIDEEGILFPFFPFFTPKNLPEIALGEEMAWGVKVPEKKWRLATALLQHFSSDRKERLMKIDLNRAEVSSLGQREIVLVLKEKKAKKERLLRLSTKNYAQELSSYFILRDRFDENQTNPNVVDLRVAHVAYLTE